MSKIKCIETRLEMAQDIRQEYKLSHHPMFREYESYNYKSYLTEQKATNENSCEVYKKKIKSQQINIKILQAKIDKRQSEVSKLRKALKSSKDAIKAVADERSFRQKMNRLAKKYSFLSIDYQGDDDVYTTWVWHNKFYDSDPYFAEHYFDSYQDAHERCLAYIKHHEEGEES